MKRLLVVCCLILLPSLALANFSYAPGVLGGEVVPDGLDPTGVTDSTANIRTALATTTSGVLNTVRLPPGKFLVTNSLTIQPGQCVGGAAAGGTQLYVTPAFNASAAGVVIFNWPLTAANTDVPSPCLHDVEIFFQQPTVTFTRAGAVALGVAGCGTTLACKYPPAVYSYSPGDNSGDSRPRLWNLKIGNAWDGIWFDGLPAGANGGPMMDSIEIGAYDKGLHIDNLLDICHLTRLHFWNFGITVGSQFAVYTDGNTIAAEIGRCDGLSGSDWFSLVGGFHFLADSTTGLVERLTTDQFPPTNTVQVPRVQVDGGTWQFTDMIASGHGNCAYDQTDGSVYAANPQISSNISGSNNASACISAGTFIVSGGAFGDFGPNMWGVYQTGATTKTQFTGVNFSGTCSVTALNIQGGGEITATGNTFSSNLACGGTGFNIAADNVSNVISHNMMGLYSIQVSGGDSAGGTYWQNYGAYFTSPAVVTGCGSPGCTIAGNNLRGGGTVGTGGTGATVTFAHAFLVQQFCSPVNLSGGATPAPTIAVSASSLVFTNLQAGQIIGWKCEGA